MGNHGGDTDLSLATNLGAGYAGIVPGDATDGRSDEEAIPQQIPGNAQVLGQEMDDARDNPGGAGRRRRETTRWPAAFSSEAARAYASRRMRNFSEESAIFHDRL
jgi:hypothetical protein